MGAIGKLSRHFRGLDPGTRRGDSLEGVAEDQARRMRPDKPWMEDVDFAKQIRAHLGDDLNKLIKINEDMEDPGFRLAIQDNPDLIKAWDKLSEHPTAFRINATNLKQRSLLDEYGGKIAKSSDKRKGNFGEIGADLDLNSKGYESLVPRIDNIDASGHQGIDGIFLKDGKYYIVEGKYAGSAGLNPANPKTGLDRQMSDAWIDKRLNAAVGDEDIADDIRDAGYERVLAKVKPDGSVTYRLINEKGFVKRGHAGDFTP
jgi:hypothetical protein